MIKNMPQQMSADAERRERDEKRTNTEHSTMQRRSHFVHFICSIQVCLVVCLANALANGGSRNHIHRYSKYRCSRQTRELSFNLIHACELG